MSGVSLPLPSLVFNPIFVAGECKRTRSPTLYVIELYFWLSLFVSRTPALCMQFSR